MHWKNPNRTRWRCRRHNSLGCINFLYTTGHTVFVQNDHNHACENINKDNLSSHLVNVIHRQIKNRISRRNVQ
ncbi:unnamed protein product [Phyllotreta striolata]|uniref:FLYWCH-type domain-containing protein n=1 Tax=Phyllotreta striolata TaxID=444603 RepID=A0A9N9XP17_PHYSR|nr:unnamed protein product [Phyllotreta striolata]